MKRVVFTIPSYRRPDRQHFVKWLHEIGVPKADIYIFTQNDEDRAAYRASVGGIANVVGENGVGISFNRNQSMRLSVPDARVVQVDDGVRYVGIKGVGRIRDAKRLVAMCNLFFDFCEKRGYAQWSIGKASNPLCMTGRDKIDYPFFGTFVGMIDRSDPFNPSMKMMEDLERNCRMLRAGKHMIIFDYAHVDCKHNQGGGAGRPPCKGRERGSRREHHLSHLPKHGTAQNRRKERGQPALRMGASPHDEARNVSWQDLTQAKGR